MKLSGLNPSPVFDGYWRFAHERQHIYLSRLRGDTPPWTTDSILADHRFTNVYRASDRVSQFLISEVIYNGPIDTDDVVFRVLLFKIFNRIDTWRALESRIGPLTWRSFNISDYSAVFDALQGRKKPVYSPAYIIPPVPGTGQRKKYEGHLNLIRQMMRARLPAKIISAASMSKLFEILIGYPGIGPFLAYQLTIDLNYSPLADFSEMEFVKPGPGALDGIAKCFPGFDLRRAEQIIEQCCEEQDAQFHERGLSFGGLFGRPLQLIDAQNLFCEISKYARVAFPAAAGVSGRVRIKQRFTPTGPPPAPPVFPPKWKLVIPPGTIQYPPLVLV